MSSGRKICCYKTCDKKPGHTLFKFPTEEERFTNWCINGGIALKGEVNMSETRYFCDKHFSDRYVSNQARRKMLVHTAIPERYKDSPEVPRLSHYTLTGQTPQKKRKLSFTVNDLALNIPTPVATKSPPTVLNQQRVSNRKIKAVSTTQEIDDDSQTTDDQVEETYKIETTSGKDSDLNDYFQEFNIQPQTQVQKKFQYIVVKPKKVDEKVLSSPASSPLKRPRLAEEEKEEVVFISEELNASEEQLETIEDEFVEIPSDTDVMDGYSEFIFNGEKYVQMPKRVFEAEKLKGRKEAEKYKNILRKLKAHLNKMDLD